MSDTHREVELEKIGPARFRATNARGGVVTLGGGDDPDFTPVELLLAALAGCAAVTVDPITARRATATTFRVKAEGEKVRDETGTRMTELTVTFEVEFPEGPDGDAARAVLPSAIQRTHDRLCTVSRTVETGEPVVMR
ncbi:OsmC family protein [Nocardioides jejuensis]|uniref:OsmC family peroxiredoxin n=1 Tax=Nocardioides jejuensis TaxID=2502782 RepID=A0A4R1C114_9ACTN|nr:OsmC family protein [Nocardioides jejuensis]TCJ23396.1 OsmC family peroxiredoxin [Nocardioides jejuensis]